MLTNTVSQVEHKLNHNGPLQLAIGSSRFETRWKNRQMSWSQLVGKLATTSRTGETRAEYAAMTKDQQLRIKDVGGFVGGLLKDGHRKAENVQQRQLLALDLDYARADTWTMFTTLYDNAACIYSTHKHTADKPRLRLLLPLRRPVTPEEYTALGRKFAFDAGLLDQCDGTTFECHRLMFWPSTSIDAEYFFDVSDGPWLDPDIVLASYGPDEAWRDSSRWPESGRTIQDRHDRAKKQGDPLAKKSLVGAFCRTYTIEAAIAKFLPDVYVEAGPGRWTYAAGSTSAGAVEYGDGRWLYSNHGTDPISGKLVNAFDLVRLHRFGDQDADAASDTPANRLPSFAAMSDLASSDGAVRALMLTERIEDAREDFEDEATDWLEKVSLSRAGTALPTIENIRLILKHDPDLSNKIAYNEFSQRAVIRADLPWRKHQAGSDDDLWTDADDAHLALHLERVYGMAVKTQIFNQGFLVALRSNAYHPVRGYLKGLVWDGVPRVERLFVDYLGAEDTAYTRAVTRKALVAAVARVMQPGCKFDYILTLIGAQGIGKSKILRKLAKHWFNDSLASVQGKDAMEALRGFWLIELAELAAMRRADIEQLKSYISRQEDAYRESYGRRTNRYPRQCVFFGSTNDSEPLRDQTGGRRFWLVSVRAESKKIDDLDVDQIWAECVHYFEKGEPLYLSSELEAEAANIQARHTDESPKAGMIRKYLDTLLPENWKELDDVDRRQWLEDELRGFDGHRSLAIHKSGALKRERTCALEIWVECFKGLPAQFTAAQAREVNDILRRTPGWIEAASPLYFDGIVGRQRGFKRLPEKINSTKSTRTVLARKQ